VYVSNGRGGTVTPIATATSTAGPPIQVGDRQYGIAILP
jgi:DNA-binding beta-propeller fold protein YncE